MWKCRGGRGGAHKLGSCHEHGRGNAQALQAWLAVAAANHVERLLGGLKHDGEDAELEEVLRGEEGVGAVEAARHLDPDALARDLPVQRRLDLQ